MYFPPHHYIWDKSTHLIESVWCRSSRHRPTDQVLSRCAAESHPQAPTNLLFGEKWMEQKKSPPWDPKPCISEGNVCASVSDDNILFQCQPCVTFTVQSETRALSSLSVPVCALHFAYLIYSWFVDTVMDTLILNPPPVP